MLALPSKVDFAIAVSTIGKLRPNVPSIPTRKIVHSDVRAPPQMPNGRPHRSGLPAGGRSGR